MSDSAQDKHLPASARKLQKAREDGQVVRSKDLGHFLVVLAATGVLVGLTPMWMQHIQELLTSGLRFDARSVATPDVMLDRLGVWVSQALWVVVPFGLGLAVASAAASILAGGWVMSFKVIGPNFGKLNPLTGIGNVFSKQQLIDALKASVMGLLLGVAGAIFLQKSWPSLVDLLAQPLPAAVHDLGVTIAEVLTSMLLVIAAFALLDWPLQRYLFAERMKMSHQEVKDEFKQQEGNMEVKGRMKQKMREMARKRMLAAVPKADLVVMNPTHFAVALKYDPEKGAPEVTSKGAGEIARGLAEELVAGGDDLVRGKGIARGGLCLGDRSGGLGQGGKRCGGKRGQGQGNEQRLLQHGAPHAMDTGVMPAADGNRVATPLIGRRVTGRSLRVG